MKEIFLNDCEAQQKEPYVSDKNNDIETAIFNDFVWEITQNKAKIKRIKKKAKNGKIKNKKAKKIIKKLRRENQNLKIEIEQMKLRFDYDMSLIRIEADWKCTFAELVAVVQFPEAREQLIQRCAQAVGGAIPTGLRGGGYSV